MRKMSVDTDSVAHVQAKDVKGGEKEECVRNCGAGPTEVVDKACEPNDWI